MPYCNRCELDSPGTFCPYCGKNLQPAESVERNVAVLIADLEGSSSLAEEHPLEEAARYLANYQDMLASAVHDAGGHVAQVGGDDFVAYFGYPNRADSASDDALRAAFSALRKARVSNFEGTMPKPIRIGIHQAPTLIFQAGNGDIQFGGNTPVVAARLQTHAPPNGILVSSVVHARIERGYVCEPTGPLTLKGIAKPVDAYRVLGPVKRHRLANSSSNRTGFVGRDDALEWLQAMHGPRAGEGYPAVVGEPGIGKTRLLQEFVGSDSRRWIKIACEEASQSTPLHLFLRLVDMLDPAEEHQDYATRLSALLPDYALTTIQGLFGAGTQSTQDGDAVSELADLLIAILRRHAIGLWVDDIQWLDQTSRKALQAIPPQEFAIPLLISARPEAQLEQFATLALGPLTIDQTEALVVQISNHAIGKAAVERMYRMTNGNPLYIEQLTHALAEDGAFSTFAEADNILPRLQMLPASLSELLVERIDALGTSRHLLQQCSTLGTRFELALLRAIAGKDDTVRADLEELIQRRLISLKDEHSAEFCHGLIRDAAYATLLPSERRRLHGRVAAAMEQQSPRPFVGQIGRHWENAGEQQLSIACYYDAANELLGRGLHTDSLSYSDDALSLLESQPASNWQASNRYNLLVAKGNALAVLENYGSQRRMDVSEETFQLSEQLGRSGSELIPILYARWTLHLARADHEVRPWAERLVRIASENEATNPPQIDVTTRFVMGTTLFLEGRITDAIRQLEDALAAYDHRQHTNLMRLYGEDPGMYSSVWLQWAYVHAGRVDDARRQCEASDRLAEQFDDPMARMLAMVYRLHVYRELEQFKDGIELSNRIIEEASRNGLDYYAWMAKNGLPRLKLLHTGTGIREAREVLKTHAPNPDYKILQAHALRDYAEHYLKTGDHERAARVVQTTQTEIAACSERLYEAEFLFLEGRSLQLQQRFTDAADRFEQAFQLSRSRGGYFVAVKSAQALELLRAQNPALALPSIERNLWQDTVESGHCALYDGVKALLSTQLVG